MRGRLKMPFDGSRGKVEEFTDFPCSFSRGGPGQYLSSARRKNWFGGTAAGELFNVLERSTRRLGAKLACRALLVGNFSLP